jgi:PST family polysaccharide transporter
VWSLVGYALSEAAVATGLAWFLAIRAGVWRPAASLRWQPLRELLSFSGYHTGGRLLSYAQANFDNIVVGKVIGATALGYYGLAYRVMLFPLQRVGEVIGSVAFPAFSAVQDDKQRLRSGYLRGVRFVAAITFPLTIGLAVTAPALVPVVFGREWLPAVAALQILAANGPRLSTVSMNGIVWQSIGRSRWTFFMSVLNVCTYVPAFLIGSRHGIVGVAWGFTVAGLLSVPIGMRLTARGLDLPVRAQLANVAPVLAATAVMAGCAVAAGRLVGGSDAARLLAMTAAGAVAYLGAMTVFCPRLLSGFIRDLTRRG